MNETRPNKGPCRGHWGKWLLTAASLMVALLLALPMALASGDTPGSRYAMGEDWDPEVPGQPGGVPKYKLTLVGDPVGYFNYNRESYIEAGTEINLYAWDSDGYHFVDFSINGKVVSTEPSYNMVMPSRPVTITAHYAYNPSLPDDPNQGPLKRHLSVRTVPDNTCYVNWSTGMVEVGQCLDIWATNRNGFEPVKIEVNGQMFEDTNHVEWNVTKEDHIEVTVYAEYRPEPPSDPQYNYWDPETGEMIIDHTLPGELSRNVGNLLDAANSSWDDVKVIRVCGPMNGSDWGTLRSFGNVEVIDLTQSTEWDTVPSWALEYSNAREVLLPYPESFNSYCFSDAQHLEHLTLLTSRPPYAGQSTFYGSEDIYENCVLHVPTVAIERYRTTAPWSKFAHIEPLDYGVRTFTLSLPATSVRELRDYRIELINKRTDQRKHYSVDTRADYTFAGLGEREPYAMALYTPSGFRMASIDDIPMEGQELTLSFDSIATTHDITATVRAAGTDITDNCGVEWYKLSDIDGKPIIVGRTSKLTNVPEGQELQCRVVPDESLARTYGTPEYVTTTIGKTNSTITVRLNELGNMTLDGTVTDAEGKPIKAATVTISQSVNGCLPSSHSVSTDASGKWATTVKQADSDVVVTYSAPSALSVSDTIAAANLTGSKLSLDAAVLQVIDGAKITLSLNVLDPVEAGMSAVKRSFTDIEHLDISVYNKTQNREQALLEINYPQILILEDNVNVGDVLEITLTAKDGSFVATSAEATIGRTMRATVYASLQSQGAVKATVSKDMAGRQLTAVLYDSNDKIAGWADYQGCEALVGNIAAGEYTLATIDGTAEPKLTALLTTLNKSGTAHATTKVEVADGVVTTAHFNAIGESQPDADGDKLSALMTFDRQKMRPGGIATLTIDLTADPTLCEDLSQSTLTVIMPEGCKVLADHVLCNGEATEWMASADSLALCMPLNGKHNVYSIHVTAEAEGDYSFYSQWSSPASDTEKTVPLGTTRLTVTAMAISVAPLTATADITVSGLADALADVKVYDGNVMMARTRADGNGNWQVEATLANEGTHAIKAQSVDQSGKVVAEASGTCVYDAEAVVPVLTTMSAAPTGGKASSEVHFDFAHNRIAEKHYNADGGSDIVFATEFSDNAQVACAMVHVLTHDGTVRHLPAHVDENTGAWVAIADFSESALPVNISLSYETSGDEPQAIAYSDVDGAYFSTPVSPENISTGYVYEGNPDNRLEGVRVTLLHRRESRDEYGDMVAETVPWEATVYGQQNPQYTDAMGLCSWQVPEGLWKVRYEKEGYQTVTTDWLKLPAPMLQLNIGMERTSAPEVNKVCAYIDSIDIYFDQPIMPESVYENVVLHCDTVYYECHEMPIKDSKAKYTDHFRLYPDTAFKYPSDSLPKDVYLIVDRRVKSHAGTMMNADYIAPITFEAGLGGTYITQNDTVGLNEQTVIEIGAWPAEAAAGRKVLVASGSDRILRIDSPEVTLDSLGKADIKVTGLLTGKATLTATFDFLDLTETAQVEVVSTVTDLRADATIELMVGQEAALSVYALPGNIAEDNVIDIALTDDNAPLTEEEETEAEPVTGIELSCGDSLTLEHDGHGQCKVKAIERGEYTITWTIVTADSTEISRQTKVKVGDYIMGDANGDNVVSVTDISLVVMYIMEEDPAGFIKHAADVNGDGQISVTDISQIVTLILTDSWKQESSRAATTEAHLAMTDVVMDESGLGVGEVSLAGISETQGVQFEIDVPAGLKVAEVQLTEANIANALAYSEITPGRVRVIAYSTSGKAMKAQELVNVIFAVEGIAPETAEIGLRPGIYASRDGSAVSEHRAEGGNATVTAASGIDDAQCGNSCRIYSEGRTLVVETATERRMVISNTAGQHRVIHAQPGINRYQMSESGVVVVAGKKVMIK